MTPPKSTPDEIRARFDADVERFSNLETGQGAAIDSPLMLDLVASAAAACTPGATTLLDIGCGAGNYTLKLLERLPGLTEITLVDLSRPMLDRAVERIAAVSNANVTALQGDIREVRLGRDRFDLIVAAMVLHHLREETEWASVYARLYEALKPGGCLWVADLIDHDAPGVRAVMNDRYASYLESLKGSEYRDAVLAYSAREDSPRSLGFQMDLMHLVGFVEIEVLHKNANFAAFGGRRPS